ncbi:CBL-interacting protein kinase 22 [Termitomyces sp. T112]|nr:CBL-interacting protein kinase 22 [Termitomyces sp. T112]
MLQPSPPSSISSSTGSSRSWLSFLSTSSSSTFSDFSVSSLPSPPASNSKTHAFFASPFPTRPPSPTPPPPSTTTKTHAFFAIPSIDVSPPPPPPPTTTTSDCADERTPRPQNREPAAAAAAVGSPCAGSVISSALTSLRLLKPLGHGAFSSVWLADDLSPVPLVLRSRRSLRSLRRQASLTPTLSRAGSLRKLRARVPGTRPIRLETDEMGVLTSSLSRACLDDARDPGPRPSTRGRLVAVKMTVRGGEGVRDDELEQEKERTRVAFVREVEVLRHIAHPNITPLLTHFSTPSHHLLVLPFLPGSDLLQLVNADAAWPRLRESVLRRLWIELCRAVAWMHSVGLVHRDIKLENILLTTPIFTTLTPDAPAPTLADLPAPPAPLVKLTDFGLSRFVDIRSAEERRRARRAQRREGGAGDGREDEDEDEDDEGPLLSTRCGSEAYAAPELVMGGGGRTRNEPSPPLPSSTSNRSERERERKGVYDARETDAWACGVVLYALVGRRLPFGEGVGAGTGTGIGVGVGAGAGAGRVGEGRGRMARRAWLMRIARGEYEWPECEGEPVAGTHGEDEELVGPTLARSEGARRIVARLLVRDPRRRARVGELWGDGWMDMGAGGTGAGAGIDKGEDQHAEPEPEPEPEEEGEEEEEEEMGEEELEEALREAEEEIETDGWLVDQEGIGDVARREVV